MSARFRDKRGQAPASPPLGLSDLGRLRRQLQEAEARRAETRRLEAAREAALQREANVFREAVADVQPLVTARRVDGEIRATVGGGCVPVLRGEATV